jgi:hypothetical protein
VAESPPFAAQCRLGRAIGASLSDHVDDGTAHADGACLQVEVFSAQRRQLTNAETRPGGQQDQRSPTILDGIDQRLDLDLDLDLDLGEREHWSLAGPFLPGPTDRARVPSDEVVVDGRGADGTQKPGCAPLYRRTRALRPCLSRALRTGQTRWSGGKRVTTVKAREQRRSPY